jgi:hypothetical protein
VKTIVVKRLNSVKSGRLDQCDERRSVKTIVVKRLNLVKSGRLDQCDERRAWNFEDEAGRIHEGNGGPSEMQRWRQRIAEGHS